MPEFQFCPICASPLVPFWDGERSRGRCERCAWVHYRNPTVGVAVVLIEAGRLLLGERQRGDWCVPCGHVEWDESIEEAARREFLEETGLEATLQGVLAAHSNFHNRDRQTVGIWFRGERVGGEPRPGGDLKTVAFFPLDDLPTLAYPTDVTVVRQLADAYLSRKPDGA